MTKKNEDLAAKFTQAQFLLSQVADEIRARLATSDLEPQAETRLAASLDEINRTAATARATVEAVFDTTPKPPPQKPRERKRKRKPTILDG